MIGFLGLYLFTFVDTKETITMINLIVLGLFVLLVGLGVLGGFIKGLGKARIRGICVIACAVAAVVLTLVIKNVLSVKNKGIARSGNVLKVYPCGHVDTAIVSDVLSVGAKQVIEGEEHINQLITNNVISQ